jgi:phosphodiesterase/alkaline phosphatase D-like protein
VLAVALAVAACDDNGSPPSTPAPQSESATFALGVASGDVTPDSAMLWTRADGAESVTAEIATTDDFSEDMTEIAAETSGDRDFTVKVVADGLQPGTRYYYRFRAGDETSATGTFVTAPDASAPSALHFVFSGDSDGARDEDGNPRFNNFEVLDAARAENPDFFLYFGDTIYGDRDPEATDLDGYRAKYRENRGYRALADILAATSTYNTWDDHEVYNDYAGTTVDEDRFDDALQAFREYMPIDDESGDPGVLYRTFRWGKDVEIIVLDERSFRDPEADAGCEDDPLPAGAFEDAPQALRGIREFVDLPDELPEGCEDMIRDESRSMLGEEQQQFLFDRLRESDATWKIIVNSVPIQTLLIEPYDRWDGYPAARRELLEYIRDEGIDNVVFLTTDFHANIFGPVRIDQFGGDDEPVAYEAIAGPIATNPFRQDIVDLVGEGAADATQGLLTGLLGVDCADIDSYAYALVDVDAASMTITAKDEDSNVLCEKRLEAKH